MRLSRRNVIGLAGAAALPGTLRAAVAAPALTSMLLVDAALPGAQRRAAALADPAARLIWIEGDPVRLWRGGLGKAVAASPGQVVALVGYDKAMLLAGLAREDRVPARHRRGDGRTFEVRFGEKI